MTIEYEPNDPLSPENIARQKKRDALAKAREAKAAKRAAAPVTPEVRARNLDNEFRPLTEEELAALTPAEREARHAKLTAAIDALRPPVAPGAKPGTIVGEGLTAERVPYTAEWFTDIVARQKEDPNYRMHEVIPVKWGSVKVNGVAFGLAAGVPCLLPTPHYIIYLENMRAPAKVAEEFKAPENVSVRAGYMSPVHLMPGVWIYTPLPKE
jgi:hypothetical protein